MALEPDIERDAPQSNTQHPPKLLKFRDRTGINTPDLLALRHGERPGPNVGVYARVIQEERKAKWQYHAISSVINVIFLGQILVAAALTALGASNTSHIAITILGSVNTVIAGVQTYLKGQGLPNRLRQYEFGLRKLREYIEDRERELNDPESKLDIDVVVKEVSDMYAAVRQTAEDNTPDTYLPMGGAGKKLLGEKANAEGTAAPASASAVAQADAGKVSIGSSQGPEAHPDTAGGKPITSSKFKEAPDRLPLPSGDDSTLNVGSTSYTGAAGAEGAKVEEAQKPDEAKGEASGTSPNQQDETEDAPLLKERRKFGE